MSYCGNCGTQLKEGAKFCQKCGTPVQSSHSSIQENKNGNLYIRWDGRWTLIDKNITISVNGLYVGDYSFREGFEVAIPIDSSTMIVEIKYSITNYKQVLTLSPLENYSYNLYFNSFSGCFGFSLCDSNGIEIMHDSIGEVMGIVSFLLPIVGFIYALAVWKEKPGASRAALTISIIGLVVSIVLYYFRYYYL